MYLFFFLFQNAETLRLAAFEQSVAKNASSFDWKNFKDPLMKREFQHLTDIGISALDDKEKLKQVFVCFINPILSWHNEKKMPAAK